MLGYKLSRVSQLVIGLVGFSLRVGFCFSNLGLFWQSLRTDIYGKGCKVLSCLFFRLGERADNKNKQPKSFEVSAWRLFDICRAY